MHSLNDCFYIFWASTETNMRMYLILKERAASFRADPEVQEALKASKIYELATPTLNDGESISDFMADRSAFEDVNVDEVAERSFAFIHLNQLAMEHMLGARARK